MNKREKTAIGASIVGSMLLGGAIGATFLNPATASTSTPTGTSTSAPTDGRHRSGETLLTGDTAAKVTAAVQETYPDAVIKRVETDSDGVYEAHIRQADGTRATVKLDAAFAITATETGRGNGHGHHGKGGRDGSNGETLLTGDTAATVTAAVKEKYPDAVIKRVETDSDGVYEAHIRQADGTRATVKLDAAFAITATEIGHEHGHGHEHGDGDGK